MCRALPNCQPVGVQECRVSPTKQNSWRAQRACGLLLVRACTYTYLIRPWRPAVGPCETHRRCTRPQLYEPYFSHRRHTSRPGADMPSTIHWWRQNLLRSSYTAVPCSPGGTRRCGGSCRRQSTGKSWTRSIRAMSPSAAPDASSKSQAASLLAHQCAVRPVACLNSLSDRPRKRG